MGSGKGGITGRMYDHPEDEIDMMNDETFGEAALCGDWEEHHEKLAVELETWTPGDELDDYHNGYHGAQHLGRNGADSRGESPENELEYSINQLVVEDDKSAQGRPIPGRRLPVELETLIGPASPPSLYGTDDMVVGHPNIWGSPTTPKGSVERQEQGLKMLLKQLQTKDSGQPVSQQIPIGRPGYPTGGMPVTQLPQSLPDAMTLEELEGRIGIPQKKALTLEELEKQLTTPGPPVPRPGMPTPGERVPSPVQQPLPLPIGTPPQKSFMQQHGGQKRVSPLSMQTVPEHLKGRQQQLLELLAYNRSHNARPGAVPSSSYSTPTTTVPPQARPSPTQRIVSPVTTSSNTELRMVQALVSENSPPSQVAMEMLQGDERRDRRRDSSGLGKSPTDRASPHHLKNVTTTPTQQRIPPHGHMSDPSHTRSGQRGSYHHGNQGYSRQSLFHDDPRDNSRHDHRGYPGRGRGYHQNGERGGGYQNGDRGGAYHRHNDRGGGYHGDRDYRNNRGPYQKHDNRHPMGPYGDLDEETEQFDPNDEYAGLMSKKEKDWIIKIQLMQLQTDNPYLDDYYYTIWQLKKLQAEVKRDHEAAGGKGPALVLPQLAGRIEFRPYMPTQFDNALGKLTAASVHNPRQIIDVRRDSALDKEDAKGREVQRFKQLLLDIEQAYDLLLIIDDMEKQAMALPEESRPAVLESRKEAVRSLYLGVRVIEMENDFFRRVINIRKGVKLIARLLLMVQQSDAVHITIHLFKYLSDLSKKSWQKDVLPQLLVAVQQSVSLSQLEDMVKYANILSHGNSVIDTALQNQFGWCVMWSLLHRGESIYKEVSPLDMDVSDQKQWCEFVEQVAESLSGLPTTSEIEIPRVYRESVEAHFSRLLDRNLYLSIEDHLQSLCNPQVSSS